MPSQQPQPPEPAVDAEHAVTDAAAATVKPTEEAVPSTECSERKHFVRDETSLLVTYILYQGPVKSYEMHCRRQSRGSFLAGENYPQGQRSNP